MCLLAPGALEIAAVVALVAAGVLGLVVPVMLAAAGLVLVWCSRQWTSGEKAVATALSLGPSALFFVVIVLERFL